MKVECYGIWTLLLLPPPSSSSSSFSFSSVCMHTVYVRACLCQVHETLRMQLILNVTRLRPTGPLPGNWEHFLRVAYNYAPRTVRGSNFYWLRGRLLGIWMVMPRRDRQCQTAGLYEKRRQSDYFQLQIIPGTIFAILLTGLLAFLGVLLTVELLSLSVPAVVFLADCCAVCAGPDRGPCGNVNCRWW